MIFGPNAADKNNALLRRDNLAGRQRRTKDYRPRRGHRREEHQAADAAIVDTVLGVGIAGGGRLVAGGKRMADDAVCARCRLGRGACRAKAHDQACQRNRISRRQRNNAPPQRPPGEILTHGQIPATTATSYHEGSATSTP